MRFWSLEEIAVQQTCELRTIPRVTLHVQHAVLYFRCVYICVASGAMLFYSDESFSVLSLVTHVFPQLPVFVSCATIKLKHDLATAARRDQFDNILTQRVGSHDK